MTSEWRPTDTAPTEELVLVAWTGWTDMKDRRNVGVKSSDGRWRANGTVYSADPNLWAPFPPLPGAKEDTPA